MIDKKRCPEKGTFVVPTWKNMFSGPVEEPAVGDQK